MPEDEAAEQFDRIRMLVAGVSGSPFEHNAKNKIKQQHHDQRLKYGPHEAHHGIAVPRAQVLGNEIPEQPATSHKVSKGSHDPLPLKIGINN